MRKYSDILAEMTNDDLIEKTNDPEAEFSRRDGRAVPHVWAHGCWQDMGFVDELVAWYLSKQGNGEYYYNVAHLQITDDKYIGTIDEWRELLCASSVDCLVSAGSLEPLRK
jgi:hypothetical protein